MNAYEFVKREGLEKAKAVVDGAPSSKSFISGKNIKADFYDTQHCKYGMADGVYKFLWGEDWGIHSYSFPEFVLNTFSLDHLKQAIADFELIRKDFETVGMAEYEHMISASYSDPYWISVKQAITRIEQGLNVEGEL